MPFTFLFLIIKRDSLQEITDNSFVFVNDKGTPGSAGQHGEKGEKGDPGRVRIKGKHTFCHSAFCFPIQCLGNSVRKTY